MDQWTGSKKYDLESMKIRKMLPGFTIVTVVFNDEKNIENTMLSVLNQTYPNVEYIIIDGGSTDGTTKIIDKYKKKVHFWSSEPDNGIYYAMNKGLNRATGDYILFMNSGDTFYSLEILEKIADELQKNPVDLIYGTAILCYEKYSVSFLPRFSCIKKGVMPCHQATYVKTSILKKFGGFDTSYRSSADFDFYAKFYLRKYSQSLVQFPVANFLAGGFSSNKNVSYRETHSILKKHFGRLYAARYYFRRIFLEQGNKKKYFRNAASTFFFDI
jgi:glycosyltransferase involved in cell wall biosynthesis